MVPVQVCCKSRCLFDVVPSVILVGIGLVLGGLDDDVGGLKVRLVISVFWFLFHSGGCNRLALLSQIKEEKRNGHRSVWSVQYSRVVSWFMWWSRQRFRYRPRRWFRVSRCNIGVGSV